MSGVERLTVWASVAVSPLIMSPAKTARSGFSISKILSMYSRVRVSASHPPAGTPGRRSLHCPGPVDKCMSKQRVSSVSLQHDDAITHLKFG